MGFLHKLGYLYWDLWKIAIHEYDIFKLTANMNNSNQIWLHCYPNQFSETFIYFSFNFFIIIKEENIKYEILSENNSKYEFS